MTDRQEKLMAMRGNPEAADLILDWYDKEGLPMIQKVRSAQ